MNSQLVFSHTPKSTDEIIFSCIRNMTRLNKAPSPGIPESESLAESFLTKSPSFNDLSANVMLSPGGSLGTSGEGDGPILPFSSVVVLHKLSILARLMRNLMQRNSYPNMLWQAAVQDNMISRLNGRALGCLHLVMQRPGNELFYYLKKAGLWSNAASLAPRFFVLLSFVFSHLLNVS